MITFFKDRKVESRSKVEPATGQYIGPYRTGLDTINQVSYRKVGEGIAEAGSTASSIVLAGHSMRVGDLLLLTSVTSLSGNSLFVQSVNSDSVVLSQTAEISLEGVSFDILRPSPLLLDSSLYLQVRLSDTQVYPFAENETYDGSLGVVTKTGVYTGADWKVWDGTVTTNIGSVVEASPAGVSVSGTITTATSTVTTSAIDGYGSVSITVNGTYNGVNFTPEISSDNTNWSTVSMARQDSPQTMQSSGAITNTIRGWIAPTCGARYFRVRATAWVSGTMNVRLTAVTAAIPTAVTCIPSGTTAVSGSLTAAGNVTPIPATAQGASSHYRNIDLNNTGVAVKGSATVVSSIEATNTTGAMIYLKIYNQVAAPTSANTPAKTIGLPALQTVIIDCGAFGWRFATGFGVRCVTGIADADTTNPAANGCSLNVTYT